MNIPWHQCIILLTLCPIRQVPSTGLSKKILLSSVTHVPSGLIGCALAACVSGQKEGGNIQTCRNFFA